MSGRQSAGTELAATDGCIFPTLVEEWRRQAHMAAAAAICVQLVDVSGILAIHIPTRSLLRSSSTHEPSDPPLRVVHLPFGLLATNHHRSSLNVRV